MTTLSPTTDWAHQLYATEETLAAIRAGIRRVLITSPTGGGKTRVMAELARHYLDDWKRVVLYTNRKLLVEQTSRVLAAAGLDHGVRASGYDDDRYMNLQVSSIQTENARVLKGKRWKLHDADLVLIDEAHLQSGKIARFILESHHAAGAAYVGLTATPLELGDLYDKLIVAGKPSELRACGALVPCMHFGPDEPDLKKIGRVALGQDLTEKQNVKAIMTPTIFARVLEWWKKLNPDGKPTILFAPGVGESIWFAEQLHVQGIAAAHIDGSEVWVNGQLYRTSREGRNDILAGSKDGSIKVICNRFVLREGIDAPWLAHGIFATVFGSLQSYLQSGGRLLRAYPGLEYVTLQDHGGNWWRHGSLNADREWKLEYTNAIVAGLREDGLRAKRCKKCRAKLANGNVCVQCGFNNQGEPVCCPKCRKVLAGLRCPCGFEIQPGKKSRPVIQTDGSLREMQGDIFRPRRITERPDAAKIWEQMYYRGKKSGMTFRQCEALFAMENNWGYPPRTLPLMPVKDIDFFLKVVDVPVERLQ